MYKAFFIIFFFFKAKTCYASQYFNPEIGVSAVTSKIALQEGFGSNLYNRDMAGLSIFANNYFNDFLGIEFLFQKDKSKKNAIIRLSAGQKTPGSLIPLNQLEFLDLKIKQKQSFLDANMLFRMKISSEDHELIAAPGLSRVNLHYQLSQVADEFGSIEPPIPRTFKVHQKIIFNTKLIYQYKINKAFKLRLSYIFRNTSNIKLKSEESPSSSTEIRFKNTNTIGLGLAYAF